LAEVTEPAVNVGQLALIAAVEIGQIDVPGIRCVRADEGDGASGRIEARVEAGTMTAKQDTVLSAVRRGPPDVAPAAVGNGEVDPVRHGRPEERRRPAGPRVVRADNAAEATVPGGCQLGGRSGAVGGAPEQPAVNVRLLAVPRAEVGQVAAEWAPRERDGASG
jgi:hypothetical protein